MSSGFRYHTLAEAHAAIRRRFENEALRREVEAFLGEKLLPPFAVHPRAFIFRQIASPDEAIAKFLHFANDLDLQPMCLEFHEDPMLDGNDDKMGYIRPLLYDESGNFRYVGIASRSSAKRRKFTEIKCLDGTPLIEFHHNLMAISGLCLETHDASAWFKRIGKAKDYYPYVFAHCIAHAVQVEYYDVEHSASESSWVKDVVLSAFDETKARFGFDPIIVQLCPDGLTEQEYRFYWQYPPPMNQYLSELAERHRFPIFPYESHKNETFSPSKYD